MTTRRVLVALPLPLSAPYSYAVPEGLADRAVAGARVVVAVRQRELIGMIVGDDHTEPPPATLRPLLALPDVEPALTPPLLALAQQISHYYGTPLGWTLRAMLPAAFWGASQVRLHLVDGATEGARGTGTGKLLDWLRGRGGSALVGAARRALGGDVWGVVSRLQRVGMIRTEVVPPDTGAQQRTVRMLTIRGEPLSLSLRDERFRRSPGQRRVYELLELSGAVAQARVIERTGVDASVIRRLLTSGLIDVTEEARATHPFDSFEVTVPPADRTADQQQALAALADRPTGESTLLFGVTGSGKTLVYLDRIRMALASGRGALLLVPEIALTPQTVARVRGMFGDTVAVLHSGLSDGERADAWRALRQGERRVAVGARSAVFAPVQDLGVIVLDEEHETGYKNGESPRYHARHVAAMRARLEGASLILGSATPALESWTTHEGAARIELPVRVAARPMPTVELIDLRHQELVRGVGGIPWSLALDEAVTATLAVGEQVLLLLNRRGWSAVVQCGDCGEPVSCPACSISLTLHQYPQELRCHYCDHREPIPVACATCGSASMQPRGAAGTQQLERLLEDRFRTARIARMDLDTTAGKWAHHRLLGQVGRGEIDILLGTQMIAKGVDFPGVTLVGVVDADTALHLPDFRSPERTFQLIAQVAGRAGRGDRPGRVLVQTRQPDHPALQYAVRHDARGFLDAERAARSSPPYPPHLALVRVVLQGPEGEVVRQVAEGLVDWSIRSLAREDSSVLVIGPAPCPIERIRGQVRYQFLLKGPGRELGRWVRTAAPRLLGMRDGVRVVIDRDPVTML